VARHWERVYTDGTSVQRGIWLLIHVSSSVRPAQAAVQQYSVSIVMQVTLVSYCVGLRWYMVIGACDDVQNVVSADSCYDPC